MSGELKRKFVQFVDETTFYFSKFDNIEAELIDRCGTTYITK